MDKLRLKTTRDELRELVAFTATVAAWMSPAETRLAAKTPKDYAGACVMGLLMNRLYESCVIKLHRQGEEIKLTIPGEQGHALVYVWMAAPRSYVDGGFDNLRNLVGRVQQALA